MFVINYGLKCFTYFGIAYISYSAHILFEYKIVLVSLPKCDPWPLVFIAMDSALYASIDVCECNMPCVCENASMSVNPYNCDDMLLEFVCYWYS